VPSSFGSAQASITHTHTHTHTYSTAHRSFLRYTGKWGVTREGFRMKQCSYIKIRTEFQFQDLKYIQLYRRVVFVAPGRLWLAKTLATVSASPPWRSGFSLWMRWPWGRLVSEYFGFPYHLPLINASHPSVIGADVIGSYETVVPRDSVSHTRTTC
jgi:hypothetical protein